MPFTPPLTPGRNLFESFGLRKEANLNRLCVFISHSSKDKPFARSVARALIGMGVDIYFDERDQKLQQSVAASNDEKIVECIEDGLDKCSHLLGLITNNSKDSWWVSYEIGGATGRRKECAHLVASDVEAVPAFIKTRQLLLTQANLLAWAARLTVLSGQTLDEAMRKAASGSYEPLPLPLTSRAPLRFYSIT